MDTMKAAVYRGKDHIVVEEVPIPEIKAGEILVKIDTCGVCGTDLKKVKDGLVEPPRIFGHEMAGTIAEVGEGVSKWKIGDRVAVYHHIPCKKCYYCQVKAYSMCSGYKVTGTTAGFSPAGGGFAEYIRVMDWIVDEGTVLIPDDVSFEMASFLEPLNTCMKAVETAHITEGQTVLIVGQGPIGLLLTQLVSQKGAKVITTDRLISRLNQSLLMGASLTLQADSPDINQSIMEFTAGRGVDTSIIATANNRVVDFALGITRYAGTVLLFAQTKMGDLINVDLGEICAHEKRLIGSYSSSIDLNKTVENLIFTGKVDVASLVTHRFSLENILQGINLALHPDESSLKIVIKP